MSKKQTLILDVGEETVTSGTLALVSKRIEEYFNDIYVAVETIIYYNSTNHISVRFSKKKSHVSDFEIMRVREFGAELETVGVMKGGYLNIEFKLITGSG